MSESDEDVQYVEYGGRRFIQPPPRKQNTVVVASWVSEDAYPKLLASKYKKWQIPKRGGLAEEMLLLVKRSPPVFKTKDEAEALNYIEKNSAPIDDWPSEFPLEWVKAKMEWFSEARKLKPMPISALIGAIRNKKFFDEFMEKHATKHSKADPHDKYV